MNHIPTGTGTPGRIGNIPLGLDSKYGRVPIGRV